MTGLIGWWPLHENSGQANDLSGNGNHGTLSGPKQGVAGKMGQTSYYFDYNNYDYVSMGNIHQLYDKQTVTGWFKIGKSGFQRGGMLDKRKENSPYLGWTTRIKDDGTVDMQIRDQNDVQRTAASNANYNDNKWHHAAYIFDRNNPEGLRIYVDGEEVNYSRKDDPRDVGDTTNSVSLTIGRWQQNSGYSYDGNFSDIRLYNRILTPQEIQKLYRWGSGDHTNPKYHNGNDPGAVSRWKFESGNVTKDSWSSNTLTDNTSAGTTSDAIRDQAKSFDGSNDSMSSNLTVDSDSPFSASLWMKTNDVSKNLQYGVTNRDGSSNGFGLYLTGSDKSPILIIFDDSNNSKYLIGNNINENTWFHVAGVWNGSKVMLYQNGVKVVEETTSYSPSSQDIELGRRPVQDDSYWNGNLEDVRIYDRALKPHEVFQLYQWGTRGRDMNKLTVNQRS